MSPYSLSLGSGGVPRNKNANEWCIISNCSSYLDLSLHPCTLHRSKLLAPLYRHPQMAYEARLFIPRDYQPRDKRT